MLYTIYYNPTANPATCWRCGADEDDVELVDYEHENGYHAYACANERACERRIAVRRGGLLQAVGGRRETW